ncbi:hypothetical protein [Mesorhizobium sp. M3A.F.Ca.ET.201.01.1.1]|nr:hypothetical protein [Mesorhizobium sp. M3A.F.Ca.ET.201.01.1.1]
MADFDRVGAPIVAQFLIHLVDEKHSAVVTHERASVFEAIIAAA